MLSHQHYLSFRVAGIITERLNGKDFSLSSFLTACCKRLSVKVLANIIMIIRFHSSISRQTEDFCNLLRSLPAFQSQKLNSTFLCLFLFHLCLYPFWCSFFPLYFASEAHSPALFHHSPQESLPEVGMWLSVRWLNGHLRKVSPIRRSPEPQLGNEKGGDYFWDHTLSRTL